MSVPDHELDRLLRELRDEALPESALASVRAGVRREITARKRRRAVAPWLALAAAAAAVWFAAVVMRAALPVRPPVVAVRTPAAPPLAFQQSAARRAGAPAAAERAGQRKAAGNVRAGTATPAAESGALRARATGPDNESERLRAIAGLRRTERNERSIAASRRVREDASTAAPSTGETQFIHLMTDDPNVVILWALNTKGETR